MLITQLRYKTDASVITVDGNDYSISNETVVTRHIKSGQDYSKEEFYSILEESDEILCKNYLFKYLQKYNNTEQGYRNKLYEKGYRKRAIDKAITLAIDYKYIDDTAFTQRYIESYFNKKGEYLLKQDLRQKGIDSQIIENCLRSLPSQSDVIITLANKYLRNKDDSAITKQKLIRHLASKGFAIDDIKEALGSRLQF